MSRTFLALDIRGAGFAIDLEQVVEVLRMVAPTHLPGLSPDVLGVVDFRGVVVPLLDPARRLGLCPRAPTLDARIVVCASPTGLLGLVVDDLRGLVDAGDRELCARDAMPMPAGAADGALVDGAVRRPEGLLLTLDLGRLLTTAELTALQSAPTAPEGA